MFTEREALASLAQRTGRPDDAGARELAGELGFLPRQTRPVPPDHGH